MVPSKYTVNYDLRRKLTKEDWEEYQRLTAVANDPPMSELRTTKRLYVSGFVLTGLLLIPMGIAIGTSSNGGGSAVPWMVAVIGVFFLTLFAPLFAVFGEMRDARERADAGRSALADKVAPKSSGRGHEDEDHTPRYPVTGEYNPGLYMARGGPAMAQWLEDTGYGDWETYEANKPD